MMRWKACSAIEGTAIHTESSSTIMFLDSHLDNLQNSLTALSTSAMPAPIVSVPQPSPSSSTLHLYQPPHYSGDPKIDLETVDNLIRVDLFLKLGL